MATEKTKQLKEKVEEQSWQALKDYFDKTGNGPAAKVACTVISTLSREEQAANNKRQLDITERRLNLILAGIPIAEESTGTPLLTDGSRTAR